MLPERKNSTPGPELFMKCAVSPFVVCSFSYFAMASTLGERKRKSAESFFEARAALKAPDLTLDEDVQAVFRRHFEAQFKPLSVATNKKIVEMVENVHSSDDSDESEWNGISEGECLLRTSGFANTG
jgi:hypothetical protein